MRTILRISPMGFGIYPSREIDFTSRRELFTMSYYADAQDFELDLFA
jgi:hypothetical protein